MHKEILLRHYAQLRQNKYKPEKLLNTKQDRENASSSLGLELLSFRIVCERSHVGSGEMLMRDVIVSLTQEFL